MGRVEQARASAETRPLLLLYVFQGVRAQFPLSWPPLPVPAPVEVFHPEPASIALYRSVPETMAEYSYVKSTKLVLKGTKAKR